MNRLFAWLFLAAIVLGAAGLAFTTERSEAQEGATFSITCTQTQDPDSANGVPGILECSLLVDLPDLDPAPPGWTDTVKVTVAATYNDNDASGDASAGDQLKSLVVTVPDSPSLP